MADFGSFAPSDGFDYTALMPGLGALAGFGAAAQTSRLPISNASLLGSMAGGLMQGVGAQRQAQLQQQRLEAGALQLGMAKGKMGFLSQAMQAAMGERRQQDNSNGTSDQQGVSANGSTAQTIPLAFRAAAQEGAATPTAWSGVSSVSPSAPPSSTHAYSDLPFPNATPFQNAVISEMLVPGAGKGIVDRYYPGPTQMQRDLAAANIPTSSTLGQRLLSFAANKQAGVAQGYQIGENGQESYVPGGNADPHILGEQASAQEWGKAPAEAWLAAMSPKTLRGPGSVYVNPYFGQTVQIPNEIDEVDPTTLAEYKRFVPLGLTVTGNGPLSAATGAGVPNSNGARGSVPLAFRSAARQPGAASVGGDAGTSFMTAAPPGQREIVEGAAKNYTDEGRKAYSSAVAGLGSLQYIDRAIDQLGPTGWQAMGEGASIRNELARTINTMSAVMGGGPLFNPNKLASWEDFEKETTLLGMKGLSQIFGGSREAASIITTSIHAVPNPGNSYIGGKLLVNAYREGFQREVDLRNFETNWIATHGGNLTAATEAFNQKYPPQAYSWRAVSKVQPYPVKSPADLDRFLPGTYIRTPDGVTRMVPGTPYIPLQGATGG